MTMQKQAFYHAKNICQVLQTSGFQAVFAGGAVRDMLLDLNPNDYDVATNATPSQVRNHFPTAKFVGESFGVSLVDDIEIATFRTEGSYSDGRRPDHVHFRNVTLEMDAMRRDLTINAIYFDPVKKVYIDPVGGMADIEKQEINFVGDANDRLKEDYLRILRAIRFGVKYDFNFSFDTLASIRNNAESLIDLSGERILEELKKALKLKNPDIYFRCLQLVDALKVIFPEVANLENSEQDPKWHPEGDVFTHTLKVLENIKTRYNWRIKFAGLLHDIGKPSTKTVYENGRIGNPSHAKVGGEMAEIVCRRLKMSNEDTIHITNLVKDHMKFKDILNMKKSTLRRFVAEPHFRDLIKLCIADVYGSGFGPYDMSTINFAKEQLLTYKEEPVMPKPFVNGFDLIQLGIQQGPIFKELLDKVMDLQLEGTITDRKEALKILAELTI